jgi:hypothetical protein
VDPVYIIVAAVVGLAAYLLFRGKRRAGDKTPVHPKLARRKDGSAKSAGPSAPVREAPQSAKQPRSSEVSPARKAKAPSTASQKAIPARPLTGSMVGCEAVIPGELTVSIHAHTLTAPSGPVPCWTYVSDGLWPLGQKEIVFTVQRRAGEAKEAYPRDLFQLYAIIHRFAADQQLVDVGGCTTLNHDAALLGRKGFAGVLYCPPQLLNDVRIPAPSLTALVLTGNELAAAQQHGAVRMMATLGRRHRYFPTAPWADRDRDELASPEDLEQSLLAKVSRVTIHAASVRLESEVKSESGQPAPGPGGNKGFALGESRIVLRLRPAAAAILKELSTQFSADSTFALIVGPDPSAQACLSWEPGQKDMFGISAPDGAGGLFAGNFILFLPEQQEDGGQVLEDGFLMHLRDSTWERIRKALATGQALSIPSAPGKSALEIIWAPELDADFVDPLESQVKGGWRVFGGGGPRPAGSAGAVHLKSISLLTIEGVLGRRVETTPLSDYINAIREAVESHLAEATDGPGQDLAVECEVRPEGSRTFQMLVRPEAASHDPTGGLNARIMKISPPQVVGPIRFQLNIQLRGGSERAKEDR